MTKPLPPLPDCFYCGISGSHATTDQCIAALAVVLDEERRRYMQQQRMRSAPLAPRRPLMLRWRVTMRKEGMRLTRPLIGRRRIRSVLEGLQLARAGRLAHPGCLYWIDAYGESANPHYTQRKQAA